MRSRLGDSGRLRRAATAGIATAAVGVLAACFPTYDWRESRPEGSSVRMMFPCRPHRTVRSIVLGSQPLRMTVASCSAAGTTFGVAYVEVAEPGRVAPTLEALREVAAGNVAAAPASGVAHRVAGATPNDRMERVRLLGSLPDGRAVTLQAVFFVRGLRVYQASIVGAEIASDAAETFFAAIRVEPAAP